MKQFQAGDVVAIGPRYNGGGSYVNDNGTGDIVRLLRPLPPGDWYTSKDLGAGLGAAWDWISHESRLVPLTPEQAAEVSRRFPG